MSGAGRCARRTFCMRYERLYLNDIINSADTIIDAPTA
jgi:hypothetical protein